MCIRLTPGAGSLMGTWLRLFCRGCLCVVVWLALVSTHLAQASVADFRSRAESLISEGRAEEAVQLLEGVLESDSDAVAVWIELGDAYQALGDLGEARKAYRGALKRDPDSEPALRGWGEASFADRKWGEVKKAYAGILDALPEDRLALYRRAIAYRETGIYKATAARWLDWRKSESLFRKLANLDSFYEDVYYEYAHLKRAQGNHPESIRLAERQVALKPGLPGTALGVYRMYRHYLDSANPKKAAAWLGQHRSAYAGFYLGEALRLADRTSEADSQLTTWVGGEQRVSVIPALLSQARLAYADSRPSEGEQRVFTAVESIRDTIDAALVFEDTKYVVNEAEMAEYQSLSEPEAFRSFFRKIWNSRDLMPAEGHNGRLAEHFRRLLYAERHYLYDGFRTWFDDPDKLDKLSFPPPFRLNNRFNDIGLVYIRHGEPRDVNKTMRPSESWLYSKTNELPEMTFHFVGTPSAYGYNWQLVENPEGSGDIGRRLRWDVEKQIRETHRSISQGLATDRPTWGRDIEPLDVRAYVAAFAGADSGQVVEVYYDIEKKQLGRKWERRADTAAVYDYGLTVHDEAWHPIAEDTGTERRRSALSRLRDGRVVGMMAATVNVDTCQIVFNIRPRDGNHLAVWKGARRLRDFSGTELAVSSILPALLVTEEPDDGALLKRGKVYVTPNPSRRFERDRAVYGYFEVYNLTPDEHGTTSYETSYTIRKTGQTALQKVLAIFGGQGRPETAVTVERLGETPTANEYVALDLRRAGRGVFRLEVTVRDRHSGQEVREAVKIELR